MSLKHRSHKKELIDLGPGFYAPEEYRDCLKQLGRIGSLLGGDRASLMAFDALDFSFDSILDVGCGGGYFSKKLAERYPQANVLGIDYSKDAILFAKETHSGKLLPNLSFEIPDTLELNYPEKSFDIVTCTLVCHHMQDEMLVDFLQRACRVAKKRIIINDLHRHPLAYAGFKLLAYPLFRNRLITHDGQLSIRRAFKKNEWLNYLRASGIPADRCAISWRWGFRWIINIIP